LLENAKKITVIGGGIWGQTLANLARLNHLAVRVWSRHTGEDLGAIIADTEVIISAVSIKGVVPTIEKLQQLQLNSRIIIVTATKGLEPITTQKAAILLQKLLSGESFRVYLNSDPLGTELGGTLKNVMAIASGVCDGLQLGTNAKSALLTRALPEIVRVGTCLGGCQETFFGLSGLGDLLATCNSPLSRNYQVGYQLALGLSLPEILAKLEGTAEGINTTEVLMRIAQEKNLYVPITCQVDRLLRGEISPQVAVYELMRRDLKAEFD